MPDEPVISDSTRSTLQKRGTFALPTTFEIWSIMHLYLATPMTARMTIDPTRIVIDAMGAHIDGR